MIKSFRSRALKRFSERDDRSQIRADLRDRVEAILALLEESSSPEGMRLPDLRLHALRGDRKGYWAVVVKANWRIVFRFEDGDAWDVELVDYH